MGDFVLFDGEIIPAAEARTTAISAAALYGKGIFTTVAIYDEKPFLWEKHWRRLNDNAAKIEIDLSGFNEKSVRDSLAEIIKHNHIKNARARITFFDESPGKIWQFDAPGKTSLLIQTADFKLPKVNFRLTVSPFLINSTSPLKNIKSGNYLENLLAFEDARAQNFDEAIRLNERGEITAACLANIFWLNDGKLFTPHRSTGCLAGTTREWVLETDTVAEVAEPLETLRDAEAIFLTSAGIGIVAVAEFDGKFFQTSAFAESFSKRSRNFSI